MLNSRRGFTVRRLCDGTWIIDIIRIQRAQTLVCGPVTSVHLIDGSFDVTVLKTSSTGCPVCLVLKQGAVTQLFFEVFLMFLACLDHARWAEFHLGILGPQEWKKSSDILSPKKGQISGLAQIDIFSDFLVLGVANFRINYLRQFSFNFENSCAHLAANFLNFSKHT